MFYRLYFWGWAKTTNNGKDVLVSRLLKLYLLLRSIYMGILKSICRILIILFGAVGLLISFHLLIEFRSEMHLIIGLIILISSISACVYPFLPEKQPSQISPQNSISNKQPSAFKDVPRPSMSKAQIVSLVLAVPTFLLIIFIIYLFLSLIGLMRIY